MKKLTLAMLLSLIICLASSVVTNANEVTHMTDKLIRLHVIANSDSDYDQAVKLKVRDAVLKEADSLLASCRDKETAAQIINQNLDILTQTANEVLADCPYTATCSLQKTEFDTRVYDNFTLPAGEYDALCVKIGTASGKNWWCVCYPGLCLPCATKIDDCETFTHDELIILKTPEKVRYKLFCFELFRKIKAFFTL